MDTSVVIKGGKNGLVVVLDPKLTFSEIKEKVAVKFRENSKFLGNCKMAISFEGRSFLEDEKEQLLKVIAENSDLDIACILDTEMILPGSKLGSQATGDSEKAAASLTPASKQAPIPEKVNEAKSDIAAGNPVRSTGTAGFFKRPSAFSAGSDFSASDAKPTSTLSTAKIIKMNLRSGQELSVDESVVLIGDVNPSAKIISNGNIIILGSLKGDAYAGFSGDEKAFVFALDMNPLQIRIAKSIARSSDAPDKEASKLPKIAFLEDDSIFIEVADKNILSEIKLI